MTEQKSRPFFSVVVPTYNRASLISRCLQSVLTQNFTDFELIVADDGSTDETDQIVQRFAADDSRVHYVCQENKGAGDARNLGATIAKGGYLVFLDSDDEAKPHWLETLKEAIDEGKLDVVCCGIDFRDLNGEQYLVRLPVRPQKTNPDIQGLFLSGTFAMKRTIFNSLGGYTNGLAASQHSDLRFRLLPAIKAQGYRISFIDTVLVTAHAHNLGKLRHDDRRVYESSLYILEQHRHFLRRDPRSFSSWSSSAGGAAARLGIYSDARRHFLNAIIATPLLHKNYGRFGVTLIPWLRGWVWQHGKGAK